MKNEMRARAILAANVQALRGKLGVSQEQLGELSGFHRTYVSQVERQQANVTLDSLERLAAALKVRVFKLLEERAE